LTDTFTNYHDWGYEGPIYESIHQVAFSNTSIILNTRILIYGERCSFWYMVEKAIVDYTAKYMHPFPPS
jgi:hypothetical protein